MILTVSHRQLADNDAAFNSELTVEPIHIGPSQRKASLMRKPRHTHTKAIVRNGSSRF